MKRIVLLVLAFTVILAINKANAQNKNQSAANIEVLQFHSEHRCVTCQKIEKLTKATLAKSFPAIPFKLYNVDDKANAKLTEKFEVTGTALFLNNPKTGKKKNLTEFAFMKAGNDAAFDTELKKYIEEFSKN